MKTTLSPNETKLPPGDYYVGDPCYVYPDKEWDALVNLMFANTDGKGYQGVYETDGIKWACFSTRYGDGTYPARRAGQRIGDCPVDAGCIAFIPMELIRQWGIDAPRYGVVTTSEKGGRVRATEKGTISFGNISVKT